MEAELYRRTGAVIVVLTLAVMALPAGGMADDAPVVEENPWTDRRVLHIAHQGGETEAPSNTLFAFKTALEKGADVLELDVHQTADGHLVVIHDTTVDRTTDEEGRVDGMTLAEIKALDAAHWFIPGQGATHDNPEEDYVYRGIATGDEDPPEGYEANDFTIPTLEDVLETFPDTMINIEIKRTAPDTVPYEQDLAELLAEHDRGDDTIVVAFQDQSTELFKGFNQEVDTATGTIETAVFKASSMEAGPGSPSHHVALQVPITYEGIEVVDEGFVEDAHANDMAVHVWTIGDEETMRMLIDIGVDGIMTNTPTLLEDVLQDEGVAWDPS